MPNPDLDVKVLEPQKKEERRAVVPTHELGAHPFGHRMVAAQVRPSAT